MSPHWLFLFFLPFTELKKKKSQIWGETTVFEYLGVSFQMPYELVGIYWFIYLLKLH